METSWSEKTAAASGRPLRPHPAPTSNSRIVALLHSKCSGDKYVLSSHPVQFSALSALPRVSAAAETLTPAKAGGLKLHILKRRTQTLLQEVLEFLAQPVLDLSHPLSTNSDFLGDILQGCFLLTQHALLKNDAFFFL